MGEKQHNKKPHGDLIDRDELLKHPFLCGKFDRKHANAHFINGCETIGEYIRLLPTIIPKTESAGDNDDE